VQTLKNSNPTYSIIVTGHSLGAALATLTAVDLQNAGLSPIRLFNFGSPRVGDTDFSNYVSSTLKDHSRVTHHKDMVPHSPMHERFTHIDGEWYEPDDSTTVTLDKCTGAEDPDCSYQWSLTSIDDHLWYMNVVMGGSGCDAIL
jgi:hypothetical protein